ncbi:hypothetical protein CFO_g5601 [Ceratocystis platani]|uniref:Uncharacterized protein n=1 Tax=Ceratocystis fimbriata f. sp. platani TaxID=88771 RepID=A0A0F8BIQ6_CERFI|nr:hypothetical protein CFO_g5601 [Ceratocystis platani]
MGRLQEAENTPTGSPNTENLTTGIPTAKNPQKENPPEKNQTNKEDGKYKEKGLLESRHAKSDNFTRALEDAVNRKKREMDKQAMTIRRVTQAFDMAEEKATPKKNEEDYEVFQNIFSTLKTMLDGAIQKTLAGSELKAQGTNLKKRQDADHTQ